MREDNLVSEGGVSFTGAVWREWGWRAFPKKNLSAPSRTRSGGFRTGKHKIFLSRYLKGFNQVNDILLVTFIRYNIFDP